MRNIVPLVANGRVYVASYKQLAIFGRGATKTAAPAQIARAPRSGRCTALAVGTVTASTARALL